MKIVTLSSIACGIAVFLTANIALATTYHGVNQVGSGTYTINASTDGTTGALSFNNFTSFSLTLSGGGFTDTVSKGESGVGLQDFGGLYATPTKLQFDFSQASNLFNFGNGDASICLGGADYGCGANTSPGEGFSVGGFSASQGVSDLTTIASVPEPATWTVLLVGLGLAGAGLRRRTIRAAV